jgi:hypothetical protein
MEVVSTVGVDWGGHYTPKELVTSLLKPPLSTRAGRG